MPNLLLDIKIQLEDILIISVISLFSHLIAKLKIMYIYVTISDIKS